MDKKKKFKKLLMKWSVIRAWKSFRDFLRQIGFRPSVIIIPSLLSLFAALSEGAVMGLLVPTVRGVIGKSFFFIHQTPILKDLVALLPPQLVEKSATIFILLIFLIFSFTIARNVFWYFASLLTDWQVLELANKIRKLVYARYLSFGKMFFDRASSGHLHQILTGYTQQIAQELKVLQSGFFQISALIVYSGIAFFISWKLALFSSAVFPLLHYSFQVLIRKIKKDSNFFTIAYSEMGTKIYNALSCMLLVKAYTNEEREKKWFSYTSDRVRDLQFSIRKKQLLSEPFREIAGLCMMILLVGFMAFLLARGGSGQLAGFMVFFLVLRRSSANFGVLNNIQGALAGIRGPLREIQAILGDQDKFFIAEGTKLFLGLKKKLEFTKLNFNYVEGQKTLTDLSFEIAKGEMVALVGATGAGKTTLANLLMRFYDVSPGMILLDGTDIREFTLASLRGAMAIVGQETLLLNASFRTNLVYGIERELSPAEIKSVLDRSRLTELVERIGLEAAIGDRGVKLSGGERQRLSIARAMLKNPEILILDEATSALDAATEKLIQEALAEVVRDKTVLVIAHRLATVRNANRIVVMEKGTKVEEGSFSELLSNKEGAFYFYWNHQKLGEGA